MLFCKECNNIVTYTTFNNNLKFKCKTCEKEYDSVADDTLMLSVDLKESETLYKYETFINLSPFDKTLPYVEKKCPKCKSNIVKSLTIQDNLQRIFVCENCYKKFN